MPRKIAGIVANTKNLIFDFTLFTLKWLWRLKYNNNASKEAKWADVSYR